MPDNILKTESELPAFSRSMTKIIIKIPRPTTSYPLVIWFGDAKEDSISPLYL